MNDGDGQLVSEWLSGRGDGFQRLYAHHAGAIRAYFLRSGFNASDSDDLLQETFLRVTRSLKTFDAARGSLRSWLGAIARNLARKQWGRRAEPENFDPALAEAVLSVEDWSPQRREELHAVGAFVEALPEELRRLVRLRYVEGRTTRGIAAVCGMPESTIRMRLKESLAIMESWMRSEGLVRR